jgi:hypothetical protein
MKYPQLFKFALKGMPQIIAYINSVNEKTRALEEATVSK